MRTPVWRRLAGGRAAFGANTASHGNADQSAGKAGKTTRNSAPGPADDRSSTRPPCVRAIARTIARPSPVPAHVSGHRRPDLEGKPALVCHRRTLLDQFLGNLLEIDPFA